MSHGWEWFSILLIVGQFFLPFFLLLSRDSSAPPAASPSSAGWSW
jgi:hypothetical protein